MSGEARAMEPEDVTRLVVERRLAAKPYPCVEALVRTAARAPALYPAPRKTAGGRKETAHCGPGPPPGCAQPAARFARILRQPPGTAQTAGFAPGAPVSS